MKKYVIGIIMLIVASCGDPSPSRTRVLCDRFHVAIFSMDYNESQQVLAEMLDLGTEDDPRGTEPHVYLEAMLLWQAIEDTDFIGIDNHTGFLLDACKKVGT